MSFRTLIKVVGLYFSFIYLGCGDSSSTAPGETKISELWTGIVLDSSMSPPMFHKLFFSLKSDSSYSVEDSVVFSPNLTTIEIGNYSNSNPSYAFNPSTCLDFNTTTFQMEEINCPSDYSGTFTDSTLFIPSYRSFRNVNLEK